MRRADLLFPFRHEHEVDRQLFSRPADRVEGRQKRGLRPLLVHGAAAHQHFAEAGLVDQRGVPRRRRPFGGIGLLDVVHEVQADRLRRSGIQRREHAGLAIGRHLRDLLKAGLARQAHHLRAPFDHPAVLGGDRRLPHPVLEALHPFGMALQDLRLNGVEVVIGKEDSWEGERRRRRGRRPEEVAASPWIHGAESSAERWGRRIGRSPLTTAGLAATMSPDYVCRSSLRTRTTVAGRARISGSPVSTGAFSSRPVATANASA